MPYGGPLLSDLELRYPFAPRSRKFFESVPVEEGLASREVIGQTQDRLLGALGRAKYEPNMSELIEFSSFFTAALVASQDPVLASKFSKKEAERAKGFFAREEPRAKTEAFAECFGVGLSGSGDARTSYTVPFERYLSLVSKYELGKNPQWKLARQALDKGIVRMSDNMLNDLFGDCALAAIAEGVRNLRRAPFPKQLLGVKNDVIQYVPSPRPRTNKGYLYVETLLEHPVSDGRHRITWMILAPYLVNVKKLDDEQAIERIRRFVQAAGETSAMRRFIEYNVRRARRNGLLPPTFSTLKTEHPDIYGLLPKEVISEESAKGKAPP
ncbi:MAG: DNA primase noncatalytic subunit PriX [Nitrososphaerota archaeon]|nr:DNA primase noncatalytic subunit PriX [Nitrososphaerota archaeon]